MVWGFAPLCRLCVLGTPRRWTRPEPPRHGRHRLRTTLRDAGAVRPSSACRAKGKKGKKGKRADMCTSTTHLHLLMTTFKTSGSWTPISLSAPNERRRPAARSVAQFKRLLKQSNDSHLPPNGSHRATSLHNKQLSIADVRRVPPRPSLADLHSRGPFRPIHTAVAPFLWSTPFFPNVSTHA